MLPLAPIIAPRLQHSSRNVKPVQSHGVRISRLQCGDPPFAFPAAYEATPPSAATGVDVPIAPPSVSGASKSHASCSESSCLVIVTTLSTFFDVLSVLSVGGTSNSIAQMFD